MLVTRTAQAAEPLYRELIGGLAVPGQTFELVCAPVRVAAFEVACLTDPSLEALARGDYRWVTFTSANGVKAFVLAQEELGRSPLQGLGGAQVACVGKTTARVLSEHGISPAFTPNIQDAAHMVSGWPEGSLHAANPRVLCIQGSNARPTLAQGLTRAGWQVTTCTVYRMETYPSANPLTPSTDSGLPLQEMEVGAVLPELSRTGAVLATSPQLLTELFEAYRTYSLGAETSPNFPPVIAIGASTGARAAELGLSYTIAEHPQTPYLVKAIKSLANQQNQGAEHPRDR